MIGFADADADADAGGGSHALLVLVDHNLSGRAKDAWLADDLDETVDAWRSTHEKHIRVEEIPADEALRRLHDAMARTEAAPTHADERTEHLAEYRALICGRLRRAGFGAAAVEDRTMPPAERRAIVADFLASAPGRKLVAERDDVDIERLATAIVDVRATGDGRPLRWSPGLAEAVLTELVPEAVVLDADEDDALPDVVRAFVRFAADRTGLEPSLRDEVLDAVDAVADTGSLPELPDFALAGPASALLDALEAGSVPIDDPAAATAALELLTDGPRPAGARKSAPPRRRRPEVHRSATPPPKPSRVPGPCLATTRSPPRRRPRPSKSPATRSPPPGDSSTPLSSGSSSATNRGAARHVEGTGPVVVATVSTGGSAAAASTAAAQSRLRRTA